MKKSYLMTLCLGIGGLLYAQTYPSSLDRSNAVEAGPSSIDLLKRSLSTSKNNPVNKPASSPTVAAPVSSQKVDAKPTAKAQNRCLPVRWLKHKSQNRLRLSNRPPSQPLNHKWSIQPQPLLRQPKKHL